jgi:hypothetical protein
MSSTRKTGMRGRRIDGGFDRKVRRMLNQDRGGTGDSC